LYKNQQRKRNGNELKEMTWFKKLRRDANGRDEKRRRMERRRGDKEKEIDRE
jgi:hypothetical protein